MQKEKYHGHRPIQSYHHTSFQHIKHTSKMHESLLKCKCDAMHNDLNSFKQNPSQKFHRNFINFENPQKLGQKDEMHD